MNYSIWLDRLLDNRFVGSKRNAGNKRPGDSEHKRVTPIVPGFSKCNRRSSNEQDADPKRRPDAPVQLSAEPHRFPAMTDVLAGGGMRPNFPATPRPCRRVGV
nr:hypothetical protein [uncultured Rhodopila sp.]